MERQEPQGEENGDFVHRLNPAHVGDLTPSSAIVSGLQPNAAVNAAAAIVAASSAPSNHHLLLSTAHASSSSISRRGGGGGGVHGTAAELPVSSLASTPTSRLATPTVTPMYPSRPITEATGFENAYRNVAAASKLSALTQPTNQELINSKLNPSVYSYSHMTTTPVQDPLLSMKNNLQSTPTPSAAATSTISSTPGFLKKSGLVDFTSSGAFFDPRAVSKSKPPSSEQSDIIAQLTREMKLYTEDASMLNLRLMIVPSFPHRTAAKVPWISRPNLCPLPN